MGASSASAARRSRTVPTARSRCRHRKRVRAGLRVRERGDPTRTEETLVRAHEGEVVHQRGRGEEAIGRVLVPEIDRPALERHLLVHGGFPERHRLTRAPNPRRGIRLERDAPAFGEDKDLPQDDRREPELVESVFELAGDPRSQPAGLEEAQRKMCVSRSSFTAAACPTPAPAPRARRCPP